MFNEYPYQVKEILVEDIVHLARYMGDQKFLIIYRDSDTETEHVLFEGCYHMMVTVHMISDTKFMKLKVIDYYITQSDENGQLRNIIIIDVEKPERGV